MAQRKMIAGIGVNAGNAYPYRSMQGDVPAVDAVELYGTALWLKGGLIITAELSPDEAIQVAAKLLESALIVKRRVEEKR